MSIEAYSKLTESVEDALDVADRMAEENTERYTHEEMFAKMREAVMFKGNYRIRYSSPFFSLQ